MRCGAVVCAGVVAVWCVVGLFGCEAERRVVARRGGLGLSATSDGGMSFEPAGESAGRDWVGLLNEVHGPPVGRRIEGEPLRRELADGEVLLVSRSPGHLVRHLMTTLRRQEHELLFDQLISEHAKVEMERAGREPREAVAWLVEREAAVRALL